MSGEETSKIFILTDTPGIYGTTLSRDGHVPVFVKDVQTLIERLRNEDSGGLVLEIHKVMKAGRQERDRLFAFAATFPLLRTRINARNGFVDYLDSPDAFFTNLTGTVSLKTRNHVRKPVQIPCMLSREDDPSMAEPVEGFIHDISPGGCFACASNAMGNESFLHIRIPALGNAKPIYSNVRWSKASEAEINTHCMGIMFIDPSEDHINAIEDLPPLG